MGGAIQGEMTRRVQENSGLCTEIFCAFWMFTLTSQIKFDDKHRAK